jgi:hypothetical protein
MARGLFIVLYYDEFGTKMGPRIFLLLNLVGLSFWMLVLGFLSLRLFFGFRNAFGGVFVWGE